MPFFQFRQNNSGGIFKEDKKRGIGLAVIVEAKTVNEANRRAKSIGLYFDGCSTGQDCSCCGDRWSEAWDKKGDAVPSMYGEPIAKAAKKNKERIWDTWYGMHVYVHYLDGRVRKFTHEKDRPKKKKAKAK